MKTPFSQFISLVTLFFISILVLGGILIINSEQKRTVEETSGGFCGVTLPYEDNEQIRLGDEIFGSQCAVCHSKDMRTDATGSALKNTWKKWNHDTLALFSYIRNPQQYLKKHPKSRIAKVHKEFGSAIMNSFQQMTQEELEALMVYIDR